MIWGAGPPHRWERSSPKVRPRSQWRPRPLASLHEARHGAAAGGVVVAGGGGRTGRRWGEHGGAGGAEDGGGGAGGDGGAAAIAAQAVAESHGVRFLGYSGGNVGCALGCALGRDACGGRVRTADVRCPARPGAGDGPAQAPPVWTHGVYVGEAKADQSRARPPAEAWSSA